MFLVIAHYRRASGILSLEMPWSSFPLETLSRLALIHVVLSCGLTLALLAQNISDMDRAKQVLFQLKFIALIVRGPTCTCESANFEGLPMLHQLSSRSWAVVLPSSSLQSIDESPSLKGLRQSVNPSTTTDAIAIWTADRPGKACKDSTVTLRVREDPKLVLNTACVMPGHTLGRVLLICRNKGATVAAVELSWIL